MKLNYDKETDSLHIDLSEKKSVDSREVAPGVVAIVGIDIDHASKIVNLRRIESDSLPLRTASL